MKAIEIKEYGGPEVLSLCDRPIPSVEIGEVLVQVAAAGNTGEAGVDFPARLRQVIAVAATTNRDGRAWFSNYGARTVHLGAPGMDILSTTPANTYSFASGTSMATPHVAGAAAILFSDDPALTVGEAKAALMFSGDALPALAVAAIGTTSVAASLPEAAPARSASLTRCARCTTSTASR